MKRLSTLLVGGALLALLTTAASAQTTVTLPNTSQTTTLTANVSEQCNITVPSAITFNVTNITASTPAAAATVTVTNLVLITGNKLKISVEGNAASFTYPTGAPTNTVTWSASDVSWNAATWVNGTGSAGTLSNTAFNAVSTSDGDGDSTTSTSGLIFTLAAKPTVVVAGAHTLVLTWKLESISGG